jgi:alpha-L-fucosidase
MIVATLGALAIGALTLMSQPAGGQSGLAKPTPEQAAWQDAEIGLFIHFDIPVFRPGWDFRHWGDRPDPSVYNPRKLDTDQWLRAAKALGARYAVLVAKHCSGFLSWQSDIYPYGMKQSPYLDGKGDVVREFIRSCHKFGIRPGIYASMSANGFMEVDDPGLVNRGKGGDPEKQARYARVCEQILNELWGRYGPLFEVWFDGGVLSPDQGGPEMLPILKRLQPKAIVFQGPAASIRWIGNEEGVAPYPCWATAPAARDYNGPGVPGGDRWLPGECDVPIRRATWFWEPNSENRLLSVDELMGLYERSVGHNCNLLLNSNPDPDGLIPEPDMKRYEEFGAEIRRRYGKSLAETHGQGSELTLALPHPCRIDAVILQERITEGERVRRYVLEAQVDRNWKEICSGASIGHKRIQRFDPVTTDHVRLRVLDSAAEPLIRRLAVFDTARSRP